MNFVCELTTDTDWRFRIHFRIYIKNYLQHFLWNFKRESVDLITYALIPFPYVIDLFFQSGAKTNAYKMVVLSCRFYKEKYPEVSVVVCRLIFRPSKPIWFHSWWRERGNSSNDCEINVPVCFIVSLSQFLFRVTGWRCGHGQCSCNRRNGCIRLPFGI